MIERICPKCKVPMNGVKCINTKCGHPTENSSTIYWCDHCEVPIYEKECPVCGNHGTYIATDIRPVFPEENILISTLISGDPFKYQKDSVWYGSNVY
ncbi:MAG: phosphoadenosine phosphosulfate reductase, partial [Butyrivibrio sp.]|nr:phosphoadenosine phosphosulfate reductase [Butyrivibrio sp.]